MSAPSDRRGFLRGLASLPLIGGGVTIIGQPTAAAVPITADLLDNYNTWLIQERQHLLNETGQADFYRPNNAAWRFHWRVHGDPPKPTAASRAAVVLSAVGCPWRRP